MATTTSATAFAAHFPPLPTATTAALSDSDVTSASSADEEEPSGTRPSSSALEDSVFSAYLQISGRSGASTQSDLSKIRAFLVASRRGGSFLACLICLERIRPVDPVWSCSAGCHAPFHLVCIQSWANQCSSLPSRSTALVPPTNWHCPKCRLNYPKDQIPRSYLCYCGKVHDPVPDPWILPHSCGEVCGRPLTGGCGHECLLLCHPGPCPPCPKLVTSHCFCGSSQDARRCAHKQFSCGSQCSKLLSCGSHRCPEKCHPGPCPPCRVKGRFKCLCGRVEEDRDCAERDFRCENSCNGTLACGKHPCERGCHSGACGDCPLQGRRTCPCGKKVYRGVACDVVVPNCGSTCEKMLSCKLHKCPERCHRGECVQTCRLIVTKFCRCGSLKKEVPCHQDLVCERKCQRMRDCGRHACKRRCCLGDCPPCPEICGRKLRCSNHKCPSPCHRGACAPCPLMVSISCFCGETCFEVPCGMEKDQKPPKCSRHCGIRRLCRHSSECRKHKCHYGACPPCRLTCQQELPCGHTCKQRCHGPVPAANPEFTLKPKKKKPDRQADLKPGVPCPPCQEIVLRSCLGHHVGEEKSMLCSDKRKFSCRNLCGNVLQCGNHYCTKPCHAMKNRVASSHLDGNTNMLDQLLSSYGDNKELAESCEDCFLPCQKERLPVCQHPCPLPCHVDNCPPCKVLIKRSCHCGSMVHVFECMHYNTLSTRDQQKVRSCGGPCHRKLLNCPHLCSDVCHPGECLSSSKCIKKVTVRCACNSLRKEWLCHDVQEAYNSSARDPKDVTKNQFGVGILPCNSECRNKTKLNDEEVRPTASKRREDKTEAVVECVPKRRKRKERMKVTESVSKFQVIKTALWKCFVVLFILVALIMTLYFGYNGVYWLSDRMNEVDSRRMRKQYRV